MTAPEIVQRARSEGIELYADAGLLRVRRPAGVEVPDQLRESIEARRDDILGILANDLEYRLIEGSLRAGEPVWLTTNLEGALGREEVVQSGYPVLHAEDVLLLVEAGADVEDFRMLIETARVFPGSCVRRHTKLAPLDSDDPQTSPPGSRT